MTMKGGVLIIGSLFWDTHQRPNDNVRKNWRAKQLEFDKRIHVFAPIRYGRTSGKDEKLVYTMVFSKATEISRSWGTAFVAPLKKAILGFRGIMSQAKQLSKAEGAKDKNIIKRTDYNVAWCIIGILFNPKFNKEKKQELLEKYEAKLMAAKIGDEYTKFRTGEEESILSPQGEILIEWPRTTNKKHQEVLDKLDFIIATCPKQNLPAYPKPSVIKEVVLKDERNYFYNNIACGITTYQDRDIINANVSST